MRGRAFEKPRAAAWRAAHGDTRALETRVERLRARRDRVLELFVDGNIDRAEKDRRLAALTQELEPAEAGAGGSAARARHRGFDR